MALELIQTGVNLPVVQLLRTLTNRLEQERLRIKLRVDTENIQDNARRGTVVTATDNIAVADDEDELSLVVVVQIGERVDGTPERIFAFSITGNLAQDELVEHLGIALATQLQRSQD